MWSIGIETDLRDTQSICRFTLQLPAMARSGPGQSQHLGTQSSLPGRLPAPICWSHHVSPPRVYINRKLKSGTAPDTNKYFGCHLNWRENTCSMKYTLNVSDIKCLTRLTVICLSAFIFGSLKWKMTKINLSWISKMMNIFMPYKFCLPNSWEEVIWISIFLLQE